jgi:hypothetical protein
MPVDAFAVAPGFGLTMNIGGYGFRIALAALACPGRRDWFDFQTANSETVIASVSEAIHRAAQRKNGLLRRFAPRNDGTPISKYDSAFPRRDPPEFCKNRSPSKSEGAGNAGCSMHP